MILQFPPVDQADRSGLLAIGGDLEVNSLELAYRSGVFPWPIEDEPLLWFAPPERAILEFADLQVSQRLRRYFKTAGFEFRVNSDFEGVIRACASREFRKGQKGTWITDEIVQAYLAFHKRGFAHSFETFFEDDLVGGMYGVKIARYFAGESMFHKVSNASKFALVKAVEHLQSQGLSWMDVQVQSPFLKSLGAKEIPRQVFMNRLAKAQEER